MVSWSYKAVLLSKNIPLRKYAAIAAAAAAGIVVEQGC